MPITLTVDRPRALWAQIGDRQARGMLWGVKYRDGLLTGWTRATLRSIGGETRAKVLRLSLELRDNRLSGAATVLSHTAEGLPIALSYWLNLERRQAGPAR